MNGRKEPTPDLRGASRPARLQRTAWVGFAIALIGGAVALPRWRIDAPDIPLALVARTDMTAWISTNGKVEAADPHVMTARVESFVREVHVPDGTSVAPGQMLLTLDATDLRAQLAHAREEQLAAEQQMRIARAGDNTGELARLESDFQRNDAELIQLGRDRDGLERLVSKQAATRDELAQATLALDRARVERQFLVRKRADLQQRAGFEARRAGLLAEQARQTIRSLEEQLRSTEVVAPLAGTVYSLPVKVGQHVRIGDSLAEVADLAHVRVRAFVDEPELGSVEVGQVVVVRWDALAGRTWSGRTALVPKAVVARGGRSVGEVLCSIENDDLRLLPNVNVDVRMRTRVRSHVLTVPRAAVRAAGNERYVFVVRNHQLHRQPITVGITGAGEYEVLKGLSDGDVVALQGDVEVREGMTVRSVLP